MTSVAYPCCGGVYTELAGKCPIWRLGRIFQFGDDEKDFAVADIFDGVRRKRRRPLHGRLTGRRAGGTAIEEQISFGVASEEIALLDHVDSAGPAMRMNGHERARRDARFNHAYAIIFEEQFVMIRRGNERVERIWPRPRLGA